MRVDRVAVVGFRSLPGVVVDCLSYWLRFLARQIPFRLYRCCDGIVPLSCALRMVWRAHSYLFLGWLFNLLPYLAVTRQAFCYHYMPALHYAEVLLPLWLQGVVPYRFHKPLFM